MHVAEVHGQDRAVEVEAPEKNALGWWGGRGAVEVDAGTEVGVGGWGAVEKPA